MIQIPEQYRSIAASASFGLLIFIGTVQVGYGIAILSGNKDSDPETSSLGDGNIITGTLNIVFGICCLVTALLKRNTLLIISSTLMTLTMLVNLITLLGYIGDVVSGEKPNALVNQESLRLKYGDPKHVDFTAEVNGFQGLHRCCGWVGGDVDNVYLNSPWHKLANQNATGKPITLPEACCIRPDDADCQTAENVKEAREKGLVYKKICGGDNGSSHPEWPSALLIVLNVLIQIACVAAAVFTVFQSP